MSSQNQLRKVQKQEWYQRNKERILEKEKNSERKKETQREWYLKNRKRCIERSIKWTKSNPEARELIVHRYTHKKHTQNKELQW